LMKRFKMSKSQAIASMKKHKMDMSFLKNESVNEANPSPAQAGKLFDKLLKKQTKGNLPSQKDIEIVFSLMRKKYGIKSESVNEAENKIADIRTILKTKKGKRIDSIFMDVETAEKVMKHYKSLGSGAKERLAKQKIQNIVKAVKKESVNEASTIDKIKDIVKNKQNMKIGGVRVDMQTANAIMTVHKALGQSNRKKYEKLPIKKMASVAFKLLK